LENIFSKKVGDPWAWVGNFDLVNKTARHLLDLYLPGMAIPKKFDEIYSIFNGPSYHYGADQSGWIASAYPPMVG
jgi:hypothetical protein